VNNSQEKVSKSIKELKTNLENQYEEIINLKESFVPASHSIVFEQPPSPSEKVEKEEIHQISKPKKPKDEKKNTQTQSLQNFKDSIEKMKQDFNNLKQELEDSIEKTKKNSKNAMETFSEYLGKSVNEMKIEVSDSLLELREKLKWLPINLKEIKGMSPNEARIFILEARVRAEENTRSEQITKIINMLDCLKVDFRSQTDSFVMGNMLPSLNSGIGSQTPECFIKEIYKNPSKSFRNSPTPERVNFQLPKNTKISMSVDIRKKNKKRLDPF
jgi:hypothetical protein